MSRPLAAARPTRILSRPCCHIQQRWKSYDDRIRSKEYIEEQFQRGLELKTGDGPRLDVKNKRISTAVGDLPISPLFDAEWTAKGMRPSKPTQRNPSGRFRKKARNNLFARMLASPVRACTATRIPLPRAFLQDFEIVQHPETREPWWAPGPLSFDFLQPATREGPLDQTQDSVSVDETSDGNGESVRHTRPEGLVKGVSQRAPVAAYLLCQKSMMDKINPHRVPLVRARYGLAIDNDLRKAVYRSDMSDLTLSLLRKHVVSTLHSRATPKAADSRPEKFLQPCASWDDVSKVLLRGCVLWLPKTEKATQRIGKYATLDIDSQFGGKLPVHNLAWLLGEKEYQNLITHDLFSRNEIIILTQWPTTTMMRLHQLLWRLQGFLPDISASNLDD